MKDNKTYKSFLKIPLFIMSFCLCFSIMNFNVFAAKSDTQPVKKPSVDTSGKSGSTETAGSGKNLGDHNQEGYDKGGNNQYQGRYIIGKNEVGGDVVAFEVTDKHGNTYTGDEAAARTKNYNIDSQTFYDSMMALNGMNADQVNSWLSENGFSMDAAGRIKDKNGKTLSWVDLAAKDAKDWEEEILDEDQNVIDKIKHHICGSVEVSLGTRWNLVSVNGFGGGSSSK